MNIVQVICGSCAGMGKRINWTVVDLNDNIGTAKKEEVVCEVCSAL